ncbi:hypothetical protein [Rhodococcus sp. NPDC060176]|uniref:hypothetical protein n=1 Tax=Rhodococcus sp. NPDC060176 TaxID=3347062 RepID=UPI0036692185
MRAARVSVREDLGSGPGGSDSGQELLFRNCDRHSVIAMFDTEIPSESAATAEPGQRCARSMEEIGVSAPPITA